MAERNTILRVRESYGRCALQKTFFEDFYEVFMSSSPAIRPYFTKTDMSKQKQLLREGISFMILYADANAGGKMAIEHIGELHDTEHVNVKPELYPFWVDSLLICIEKHDKFYEDITATAWREILAPGINYFKDVYVAEKKETKS